MSSTRFSVQSPADVLERWTLEDVYEAHDVLAMFEDLEALQNQGGD